MRARLLVRALSAAVIGAAGLGAPASGAGASAIGQAPPPLVTVAIKQATARAAVEYLSKVTGRVIVPLWKDAEHDEGLDPERIIDFECRGMLPVRAVDALAQKLDPEATWQTTPDGGIEIGPRSRLNAQQVLRIYDIRDLLNQPLHFGETVTIDLQSALAAASGSGGRSIFREERGEETKPPTRAERTQELIDLLTTMVERDQWEENGGSGATIRVYQDSLIVRAPGYIHRQLATTFADLAPSARKRP